MKRSNIRMIGKKDGEECQFKSPENVFNKIIEENFPHLKKEMPIEVQEASRTSNRLRIKKKNLLAI